MILKLPEMHRNPVALLVIGEMVIRKKQTEDSNGAAYIT